MDALEMSNGLTEKKLKGEFRHMINMQIYLNGRLHDHPVEKGYFFHGETEGRNVYFPIFDMDLLVRIR